jgi:hypothetical protein
MSPYEKAVAALNARLERLQASLAAATTEAARQTAFQSIIVTLGLGEALNDYLTQVRDFAQRRHAELKSTNESLTVRHAELLEGGKQLLEQLKANPTDREIRKQIDAAQQHMAAIQKMLRRGTNALQREVAPSVATIDTIEDTVRRFVEAGDREVLHRVLTGLVGQVRELYATHPTVPAADLIDGETWEKSIASELEQAAGPEDAYGRGGYQALLALELMALAVSAQPPGTAGEALTRGTEAVAGRLKTITERFAS